jgi:octaprenyl-diphosphate synthase
VASDLREGKATLAVIHAYEHGQLDERRKVQKVLDERALNGINHSDILSILNRHGSLEFANSMALRYAEAARQDLSDFPENEFKRALLWIPDFVVAREK